MTLIDGDRIITAQLYDDEHEEFIEKKMSIIDNINAYTNEGITEADIIRQTGWIPCSEKLPEDEQEILFSTKTGRVHSGKYHDDDSANQWYSHRDKCRAWNNVVTAWMPLPEPYQSEIPTGSERSDKVNCDKAECYNCVNHGYCDYEAERARNKE